MEWKRNEGIGWVSTVWLVGKKHSKSDPSGPTFSMPPNMGVNGEKCVMETSSPFLKTK